MCDAAGKDAQGDELVGGVDVAGKSRAFHGGPHAGQQDLPLERLGDVVVGAGGQVVDDVLRFGAGREHQDRKLLELRPGADLTKKLRAVHAGHHHVGEDALHRVLLEDPQRRLPRRGEVHIEVLRQGLDDDLGDFGVVLHEQDICGAFQDPGRDRRRERHVQRSLQLVRLRFLRGHIGSDDVHVLGEGESDRETSAAEVSLFRPGRSVVEFDDLLDERQSDPAAAVGAKVVRAALVVAVEDALELVVGNAGTVVFHHEKDASLVGLDRHADGALGELDGVAQEVIQDTLNLERIHGNLEDVEAVGADVEFDLLPPTVRRKRLGPVSDRRAHFHVLPVEDQFPRLGAHHVEELLHHREKLVQVRAGRCEDRLRVRRHAVHHSESHGDRGLEIVGDVGEEAALHLFHRAQLVVRVGEFLGARADLLFDVQVRRREVMRQREHDAEVQGK